MGRAAGALVHPDLVARAAAEQRPYRHACRLAGDIPERMLDPAHRRVDHDAAGKARGVVHDIEEILDVAGVVADQPRLEIFDHLDRRLIRTCRIRLADPVNALVRQHLHINPVAAARSHEKGLDVGDLHRRSVADLTPVEWLQAGPRGSRSLALQLGNGGKRSGSHQGRVPEEKPSIHPECLLVGSSLFHRGRDVKLDAMTESPFAVLTAVVAPAILTNACSVLCLGTSNRLARVVDRTRQLKDSLTTAEPGTPEYQSCVNQLERQEVRAHLLLRSLKSFYMCLGAFAGTALLSILGTAWGTYYQGVGFRAIVIAAFIAGSFGVLRLVSGCVLMVRENKLAVDSLTEEVAGPLAKFRTGDENRI